MEPKYPDIEVKLVGEDGNAFMILGRVSNDLRANGVEREEVDQYVAEATDGDYENLLAVTAQWVSIY